MNKLLTIIIPSFNMEMYLARGLNSLIVSDKKMLDRLDIIIVNDGSKDKTSSIGHDFEKEYPGVIRIIDKPNGHYGSCINSALKVATGLYVKVMDADDTYITTGFEDVLNTINCLIGSEQIPDALITDYRIVDEKGDIQSHISYRIPKQKNLQTADYIKQMLHMQMHAIAFRTDLLKDIEYSQTEGIMYTDSEWVTYPIPYCRTIYYIPSELYSYVLGREGQSMERKTMIKNINMFAIISARMYEASNKYHNLEFVCTFYREKSRQLISRAIALIVLYADMREVNKSLQVLDEILRKYPQQYNEFVENIRIWNRFSFNPVFEFRKRGRLSRLLILTLRTYCNGIKLISKFK